MSPLPPKPLSNAKEFFKYLIDALQALDVRLLGTGRLVNSDGMVCAVGAMTRYGGFSDEELQAGAQSYATAFPALWTPEVSALISATYSVNDSRPTDNETPSQRYARMLAWAKEQASATVSYMAVVTATEIFGPYSEAADLDARVGTLRANGVRCAVIDLAKTVQETAQF